MGISATALSTPASVDEVTLTKSGAGVISAKTGNGANQAVILNASGLMAKNLLDITTAYPAGDGSAITNVPSVIIPFHVYMNASQHLVSLNSGSEYFGKTIPLSVAPSVVAGTWAYPADADFLPFGYWYGNTGTAANGDNYNLAITQLPAGTYTLYARYLTQFNLGILGVKLDTVLKGSFDQYTAGAVKNNVGTITGIVLSAGAHTLNLFANGKNASSSAYVVGVSELALVKTA